MNLGERSFAKRSGLFWAAVVVISALPGSAFASDGLDTGDTAWIIVATGLVLFMMIPGLAMFYGGLVRAKNVLSVFLQCFMIAAIVTVLWIGYGYSLAFDTTGMEAGTTNLHSFIGGLTKAGAMGVSPDALWGTIPEPIFLAFQLTFAIITPGLIVGAFAERMRFSAVVLFSGLWFTLAYLPICHMAWGGDGAYFADLGVIDFAGGSVVHISAGSSALIAAILVGKRRGYPTAKMLPHNMTMTLTGTAMLWVGWFGFNGGSALAANGQACMAVLVTQISASLAALTWMAIEWVKVGKPSALGFATGAVGGLVAITPASGTVGPLGAMAIGVSSGIGCYWGATWLKRVGGYDDALDVVGVHGVGGVIGTLLVAVFASGRLGGTEEGLDIAGQFGVQLIGAVVTIVYCMVVSFILLKVLDAVVGLRVTEDDEVTGLDLVEHEEAGYNI